MTRKLFGGGFALLLMATLLGSCGGGGGAAVRTVLIDYKHDEFASSFLSYYPKNVAVHPGDTVRFQQAWTGEPHSVTMGRVVETNFEFIPLFEKYDSEEAARAGGVTEETIARVNQAGQKLPGMTDDEGGIYQPGARPCFITKLADVPDYSDLHENILKGPETKCPTEGKPQPAFTGRQALYNSGYIPWQGDGANEFELKIADDATPGTYKYFCNYHWLEMSGSVKVVPESKTIRSAAANNRAARAEINRDAAKPLANVTKEQRASTRPGFKPLAGLEVIEPADGVAAVSPNVFLPGKIRARAGEPVVWKFQGFAHTVSFNVPAYFPVLTVAKNGNVQYDKRAQDPVKWKVPEAEQDDEHNSVPRNVDVGEWDGGGGFHSTGLLSEGDTFSVTFTKAGTYPYACAVHPQMIGQVVVSA
jgi:plastocyanin